MKAERPSRTRNVEWNRRYRQFRIPDFPTPKFSRPPSLPFAVRRPVGWRLSFIPGGCTNSACNWPPRRPVVGTNSMAQRDVAGVRSHRRSCATPRSPARPQPVDPAPDSLRAGGHHPTSPRDVGENSAPCCRKRTLSPGGVFAFKHGTSWQYVSMSDEYETPSIITLVLEIVRPMAWAFVVASPFILLYGPVPDPLYAGIAVLYAGRALSGCSSNGSIAGMNVVTAGLRPTDHRMSSNW